MSGASFCSRYRAAILFNKNLIISGIAGFIASASVSQLSYNQVGKNDIEISFAALGTEYAAYLPLFGILFYLDNRKKYIDSETGKRDIRQVKSDLKKLFASFSVSEAVYAIVRFFIQFELLGLNFEAYQASMIGSATAWGLFFVCINVMAQATRLHERSTG
ncbi:MAG: hypothetical protein ABI361_06105 [Nitrososphaera sp.]